MSNSNVFTIAVPQAPMLAEADAHSVRVSEALYGAQVNALDTLGEWIRARHAADNYEGFIQRSCLTPFKQDLQLNAASHWVHQSSTLLFRKPDMKSTVVHRIPFGAELKLGQPHGEFRETDCGHFVWAAHCSPIGQVHQQDPLSLAKSHFLGSPYLWGGRSPQGIDCSGLVQMLAYSQGLAIPRDSGDQEAFLNNTIAAQNRQALDLVYWPGHTGILTDPDTLLHATAFTLDCRIETLQAVNDRAGEAPSFKRLFQTTLLNQ